MKRAVLFLSLATTTFGTTACSVNRQVDVRATAGRPNSAEVSAISIPFDSTAPRIAVRVEPFQFLPGAFTAPNAMNGGWMPAGAVSGNSEQVSAQLETALSRVGNFSVYDAFRGSRLKPARGERGPYSIRATITEFNELAEEKTEDRSISLGAAGLILGLAGAITDTPAVTWTGAGIGAANPTYESSIKERTGMVAMDIRVFDDRTGRLITAFDASGKFNAVSNSSGVGLFGISGRESEFQSSALGQALRVAVNDAVRQLHGRLITEEGAGKPRKF